MDAILKKSYVLVKFVLHAAIEPSICAPGVGCQCVFARIYALWRPDPVISDHELSPSLNSCRALSNKMLAGFEVGCFEPHNTRMRPHTVVETWDVSGPQVQFPVDLPMTDSHMGFATPANIASSFGSGLGGAASVHGVNSVPSRVVLDITSEK